MRKYSTLIYFTAIFQVQCELCGHPFSFKQEFCGGGSEWGDPESAEQKAQASVEEQLGKLESGDYGSVEPQECPSCGYFQSWMLLKAKGRKFLVPLVCFGGLAGFGMLMVCASLQEIRKTPPVYWPLILTGACVMIGAAGLAICIRLFRRYDPNAQLLQGRAGPAEHRQPEVSIYPGRKTARL